MTEREPDLTEDARRQGTGQGYPESAPEEQTPVDGTDRGPAAGDDGGDDDDSPGTRSGQDSRPGGATGNPDAAGG